MKREWLLGFENVSEINKSICTKTLMIETDRETDGRTDGWMGGWVDGLIDRKNIDDRYIYMIR
jgi:hypothetical protein